MPVVPLSPLAQGALGMVFLALARPRVRVWPACPGPHGPCVAPQAVAALEREHREELERLSSSLEAKHREVRGSGPACRAEPGMLVPGL